MFDLGHPGIEFQTWDNALLTLAALRVGRSQGVLSYLQYRRLRVYETLNRVVPYVSKEEAQLG